MANILVLMQALAVVFTCQASAQDRMEGRDFYEGEDFTQESNTPTPKDLCPDDSPCGKAYLAYVQAICGSTTADDACIKRFSEGGAGFAKRWKDICPSNGADVPATPTWFADYRESNCAVRSGADSNDPQPGFKDRTYWYELGKEGAKNPYWHYPTITAASYGEYKNNYFAALKEYRDLALNAMSPKEFKKELNRKSEGIIYVGQDIHMRMLNVIYVYLGEPAVEFLVGADGQSGKLAFLEQLEDDKTTPADRMKYLGADARKIMEDVTANPQVRDRMKKAEALANAGFGVSASLWLGDNDPVGTGVVNTAYLPNMTTTAEQMKRGQDEMMKNFKEQTDKEAKELAKKWSKDIIVDQPLTPKNQNALMDLKGFQTMDASGKVSQYNLSKKGKNGLYDPPTVRLLKDYYALSGTFNTESTRASLKVYDELSRRIKAGGQLPWKAADMQTFLKEPSVASFLAENKIKVPTQTKKTNPVQNIPPAEDKPKVEDKILPDEMIKGSAWGGTNPQGAGLITYLQPLPGGELAVFIGDKGSADIFYIVHLTKQDNYASGHYAFTKVYFEGGYPNKIEWHGPNAALWKTLHVNSNRTLENMDTDALSLDMKQAQDFSIKDEPQSKLYAHYATEKDPSDVQIDLLKGTWYGPMHEVTGGKLSTWEQIKAGFSTAVKVVLH